LMGVSIIFVRVEHRFSGASGFGVIWL